MAKQGKASGLRDAAEVRLKTASAARAATADNTDHLRLVHELQVHEIELEMQNNELRRSRAEREAALVRYTELYDFAPVGYLTLTVDGLIAEVNLTAATLLGMERKNLLKRRLTSFVVPEDLEHWSRFFSGVTGHDGQENVELTLQRGDGTVFHAQLDCVRHKVGTGGTGGTANHPARGHFELSIALTDITVRRRAEAQLKEAMAAAEKANRAKTDFLSSMSHELRTPLNAILGFAQLMDSGVTPPTASQKRSIDHILQAGWYLLELINEILDLALIDSGKLMLSREPVSLMEVMLECRAMIEPQAQKRGIDMTFPRAEATVFVDADRTRLKQVLLNLLFNAIKYNKPSGTVVVECSQGSPDSIRISVRDTGAGLAPEELMQLFQPFNRLGKETGAEEGTGIGLVVTKRLVELMGGTIGVDSTVGTGSTFWIELSLASAPPRLAGLEDGRVASVHPHVPGGVPLYTLLYVEDNPANLDLVEQLIARRPELRFLSAADGNLGIEFARVYQPDVILMDINLPGISGIKLLQILMKDPATAHIPVVALSANAMPHDIVKGLEAGFFRYLTKPIKVNEFMDTLDAALSFVKTEATRATRTDQT